MESHLAAPASQLKAVPKTPRKRKINDVLGCEQLKTEIIAALNYTKGSVHPCQRLEYGKPPLGWLSFCPLFSLIEPL
jgi:hypothetical protein